MSNSGLSPANVAIDLCSGTVLSILASHRYLAPPGLVPSCYLLIARCLGPYRRVAVNRQIARIAPYPWRWELNIILFNMFIVTDDIVFASPQVISSFIFLSPYGRSPKLLFQKHLGVLLAQDGLPASIHRHSSRRY